MKREALDAAWAAVHGRWPDLRPAAGFILGSGWSEACGFLRVRDALPYADLPGLGAPGVAGHAGRLVRAACGEREALVFEGRRHAYEGEGWTPVALPVDLLRRAGAPVLVLTNAAGAVRADLPVGGLMVVRDHLNLQGPGPLEGPHDPAWGPRFPDQSAVYDAGLRAALARAAARAGVGVCEGVYAALRGPAYETPAEVRMLRTLGADAVGMSTVPEAMLAHAAGLRVAALSCLTNAAAGVAGRPLSHEEVTEAGAAALPRMRALLEAFWEEAWDGA